MNWPTGVPWQQLAMWVAAWAQAAWVPLSAQALAPLELLDEPDPEPLEDVDGEVVGAVVELWEP